MPVVHLVLPPSLPIITPVVKMEPIPQTNPSGELELEIKTHLNSYLELASLFDLPTLEVEMECNPYPKPPLGSTRPETGQMWPRGV